MKIRHVLKFKDRDLCAHHIHRKYYVYEYIIHQSTVILYTTLYGAKVYER